MPLVAADPLGKDGVTPAVPVHSILLCLDEQFIFIQACQVIGLVWGLTHVLLSSFSLSPVPPKVIFPIPVLLLLH